MVKRKLHIKYSKYFVAFVNYKMTFAMRGFTVIDQLHFKKHIVRMERIHFQTDCSVH